MAVKGWLKNKDRRQRRDSPGTLTDNAALEVIQTILTTPDYTKLEPEIDALIRQRDAALVGTAQTFFKRGNENLKVKLKDTYIFGNELIVTLHIQKKQKTLKVCSLCNKKNAQHANFCRYCGEDIKEVEAMLYGDTQVQDMSLSKSREYPFIKYLARSLILT
jgi:ribosomal protein L40E